MGIDFASLYEFCIGFSSRLDSVVGFLFGFFSFYYNFTEQYDYYLDKKSPTTIPGADPRGGGGGGTRRAPPLKLEKNMFFFA
jgi:hypothetical protein